MADVPAEPTSTLDPKLRRFIENMPKTELHLHIEGTFEPELMFEIAERNGVKLKYDSVEELKAAYKFGNLQEFLDLYYQGMSVLQKEQDFYDLTYAYLKKVASQNVDHVEIFFDPQGHTERGVAFETAFNGIKRALDDGKKNLGISSKLIMSFLRHMSEEEGFKTLEQARPFMDQIDGFGLDSSENGHPPAKFKRLYEELSTIIDSKTGKPKMKMAHICEEGPPAYAREALDMGIDRGDHGNRLVEDRALAAEVAAKGLGLTVCPLSNLKLRGIKDYERNADGSVKHDDEGKPVYQTVDDMTKHPLREMLQLGLKASVHSDDPAYFGGYMNENFLAVAEGLQLTRDEIIQLQRNAIDTSFMSADEKAEKHKKFNAYIAKADLLDRFANPDAGQQVAV